jgi:pectate lyase
MKKTIFLLFGLMMMGSLQAQTQTPVDFCMTKPVGYAQQVSGGEGGTVVTVATHTELRNALRANGKAIIIVTQDITFGEGMRISGEIKDKTLLGLKGVKLISTAQVKNSGILSLDAKSSNVIIRNLIFEGPGAYDVDGQDLISNVGCVGLWVDHCEFYDGLDGNFDNTKKADNISVSWCKFGYNKLPTPVGLPDKSDDHRFTNLVGGGSTDAPDDGHYSITFQYCYWSNGCRERMPRARNAEIHILNCYYNTDVGSSTALGLEGGINGLDCYVERSYFKQIGTIYKNYNGSGSKPHTLALVDCKASKALPADIGTTPRPTYPYSALPVEEVEAAVTGSRGAGATLTVGTEGTVSSPPTGVKLPASSRPTVFYDRGADALRVLSDIPVQHAALYSLQGVPVRRGIYTPGVYIARIVLENQESFTSKIIVP